MKINNLKIECGLNPPRSQNVNDNKAVIRKKP